ncbi:MAG: class III signal peptide-containing protein [Candidatus Micrarchaeota archaeon]|nr:class III signal peptide-containing protein [Candidatus Micrarchaeota archaeon]
MVIYNNNKGQLSIEALLIIAVVIAIVLIVANVLFSSAKKTEEKIEQKQEDVFNAIEGNLPSGKPCSTNSQCASNICEEGKCK